MDDKLVGDGDTTHGPEPQEAFGRYQLLSLLGAGGMGQVWRARDSQTNRVVALKVLPERSADDDELRERFRRECRAVAQLTEPHVIPIHDFGDIDGRLYLNMRLVEGADLRTLIAREGDLSPRRAVAIVVQVAGALQAAQDAGLVHRDVKPSNILVGADDFAYLIDFGIAHASDDRALTKAGATIGTFAYMAPEAIGAAVKTDARVDVYALACVLYECLTGQPPFTSASGPQGVIAHHLHTPPPQPSVSTPDVPAGFDAVIAKGMAKNPDDRYQTALELAVAARAALDDSAVATVGGGATRSGRRSRLSRRAARRLAAAGVATLLAAAAIVLAVQLSPRGSVNSPTAVNSPTTVTRRNSAETPLPFDNVKVATGVVVDTAGNVYVADMGNDVVLRLAAGATAATPLPFAGLRNPREVAVDDAGDVYVADGSNDRVLKLAAGATAATPLPFAGLRDPRGVAANAVGDTYVTDRLNDRVLRLPAGALTATPLPFTGLNDPRSVAVDLAGNVYVADTGNNRVLRLAAGATSATPLPFAGLTDPEGVAVDTAGNVYVTDRGNAVVLRLAAGAPSATPLPFTGLVDPQGVAVDTAGNVYVTNLGPAPVVRLPVG
ncbi:MAG: serine/threonine-protein kinase PknD [Mycobacterium sp.]